MEWTAVLQGVRMMRFRDVFGSCEEQELSQLEAAELLGVSAFLVDEEGTLLSFRELGEVFTWNGLPCSFYTDRVSHYFHTPKAGGKVEKAKLTQVGRALAQLSIEHIAAYPPEARGRSERAFRTLQDRLCKELALAGVVNFNAEQTKIITVAVIAFVVLMLGVLLLQNGKPKLVQGKPE